MALCEERVYDDAMPYFCHTHTEITEQKAMRFINDLTWSNPDTTWALSFCRYTCLRKRLNNVCLDACLALLLLTHNPYWYIFMGTVAVMQHNPKGAFSTNSSFDKSN